MVTKMMVMIGIKINLDDNKEDEHKDDNDKYDVDKDAGDTYDDDDYGGDNGSAELKIIIMQIVII
jgi:hypothetical protein